MKFTSILHTYQTVRREEKIIRRRIRDGHLTVTDPAGGTLLDIQMKTDQTVAYTARPIQFRSS